MASRARRALDIAGSLTWREWLTLLGLSCLMPVIWGGLRLTSLPRLLELLDPGVAPGHPARPSDADDPILEARRGAMLVAIAARVSPLRISCLPRSVALWRLLRRRGLDAEIRLGVQPAGGDGLAAHAWVEVGGEPVSDPGEHFSPFSRGVTAR